MQKQAAWTEPEWWLQVCPPGLMEPGYKGVGESTPPPPPATTCLSGQTHRPGEIYSMMTLKGTQHDIAMEGYMLSPLISWLPLPWQ